MALRKTLLLPLDDLLSVVQEFLNPHVLRLRLDRCLHRHGVGNLRALKPALLRPAHGTFKTYEPDYLHVDVTYLPQMADEYRHGIYSWPLTVPRDGSSCGSTRRKSRPTRAASYGLWNAPRP